MSEATNASNPRPLNTTLPSSERMYEVMSPFGAEGAVQDTVALVPQHPSQLELRAHSALTYSTKTAGVKRVRVVEAKFRHVWVREGSG